MKSLWNLIFLMFSLMLILKVCAKSKMEYRTNLIAEVYRIYKPSSLTLVHDTDYHNMSEMHEVSKAALLLSKNNIFTMITSYKDLPLMHDYHYARTIVKQDMRPMNVIFLTSEASMHKLHDCTRYLNQKRSVNLIILENTNDDILHWFRYKLTGNRLLPRMISTLPLDLNQTWPDDWIILEPKVKALQLSKGLDGRILRLALVPSAEIIERKDGRLSGYFGELLDEIQKLSNFTRNHAAEENEFNFWDEKNQTWSGVVNRVANGECDLGAPAFVMTTERLRKIDYTETLFTLEIKFTIKRPSNTMSQSKWTAYFQPFRKETLAIILLVVLSIPMFITVVKLKIFPSVNKHFGFSLENYFTVWGIFCQQGLTGEHPRVSSLRLVYFSALLTASVIYNIYSACLTSTIAVSSTPLPFSTFEEFINDGSYKLAALRNAAEYDYFQNPNDTLLRRMNDFMVKMGDLPLNTEEGLKLVCRERVAFYGTLYGPFNDIKRDEMKYGCELLIIPLGIYQDLSMILSKKSPFKEIISYQISKLRSNGMLQRLESKYIKSRALPKSESYSSVNFQSIVVLLTINAGGIILGVVVLALEKIFFFCFNREKKRSRMPTHVMTNTLNSVFGSQIRNLPKRKKKRELKIRFLKTSYRHRVVQTPIKTLIGKRNISVEERNVAHE